MKKLMIGVLCLLALLVNGGFAATHWVQTRIERTIDQTIAGLQPALAQAAHGPVVVNLWDRSVSIRDIVLRSRGADGAAATTIASLTAFDVDSAGGVLTARKVEINGLQVWGAYPTTPANRGHYLAPKATLERVSLHSNAPPISAFTAQSVSIPELKIAAILQSNTLIEQTHSNIKASSIRAGKIGIASASHSTITTSVAGDVPLSLEIIDASLADLDLGLISGVFAGAASSDKSGYTTALRYGSTGPMTLYRDGSVAATCASAEVSKVAIEPFKLATAIRIMKTNQPAPGQRPSRKQDLLVQDAVTAVYENVATDWVQFNGLTWVAGALPVGRGQGSIANLQMHDLIDGKIAQLLVTGLDAITFPDVPTFSPSHDSIAVGKSTLRGLNIVELTRLPTRLLTSNVKKSSGAIVWPLVVRLIEGIDVDKAFVTSGLQHDGFGIEQLSAAWGPVIGQTPTTGQLRARISLPLDSGAAENSLFSRTGLTRADISFDSRWQWREATKTFDFGPIEIAMADIGSATGKLRLTNVTRMALIGRPDLMPAAIQAVTLGPFDMTVRDQGLLKRLGADPAFAAQRLQTIEQYRTLVGGNLINTGGTTAPPWAAFADTITLFLAQPGRRMTLALTPMMQVSLGSLVSSEKSGDDLVRHLATQIDARATVN
jgi:hypothetical protein